MNELIDSCNCLIYAIAHKYFYNVDIEDLYQAGLLGVMKALKNYKSDENTKFSTYAYNYIYGEMYLLAMNKDIKLNKYTNKLLKLIDKTEAILSQENYKKPSTLEIANYLNMDYSLIERVLSYKSSFISIDEDNSESRNLHEVLTKEDSVSIDEKIELRNSLDTLDTLEKNIINARYYEDLTQGETAKKLGVSQAMVSRYETRSLRKMKEYMYQ